MRLDMHPTPIPTFAHILEELNFSPGIAFPRPVLDFGLRLGEKTGTIRLARGATVLRRMCVACVLRTQVDVYARSILRFFLLRMHADVECTCRPLIRARCPVTSPLRVAVGQLRAIQDPR